MTSTCPECWNYKSAPSWISCSHFFCFFFFFFDPVHFFSQMLIDQVTPNLQLSSSTQGDQGPSQSDLVDLIKSCLALT